MKYIARIVVISTILVATLIVAPPAFASPGYQSIDLGTLGGYSSWANALNEGGQVVGVSFTASGQVHAFLWKNGTMTDLGTLGGYSTATSINERGQVIGASTTASG